MRSLGAGCVAILFDLDIAPHYRVLEPGVYQIRFRGLTKELKPEITSLYPIPASNLLEVEVR